MMQKAGSSDRIRITVSSLPSAVFEAGDLVEALPDIPRELIDQVLARMVKTGDVERLSRGTYRRSGESATSITSTGGQSRNEAPQPLRNGHDNTTGYALSARGQDLGSFIWQIADLLRSTYRPAQYGRVILPFAVLRRMDCVLDKTKPVVLNVAAKIRDLDNLKADEEIRLRDASGYSFFNISQYDFKRLVDDSTGIRKNLANYIDGFSANVRDIFERYAFDEQIDKLDEKNLLYELLKKFGALDLHPEKVTNPDMGSAFEYLIRKFNELSNETAGDHYTPRDAIALAVDLVLNGDDDLLTSTAPLRMIYDPTAGTGGMLSIAEDHIKQYNSHAKVAAYGQEVNDESYAICKADMLIKGQDVSNIVLSNTLTNTASDPDPFPNLTFDYMLSNPPYGVDWKNVEKAVREEYQRKGSAGRFGPGLPRISDGQLLFLLHLVSKMRAPSEGGSRIGLFMNGSPLFTGGAGSGESEIRRHLFEHDLIEAIVALPTDMFYNTNIATYIWVVTNRKRKERKGTIQLVDGTQFWHPMRKSLGSKRRYLDEDDITRIVKLHDAFQDSDHCRLLPNEAFGYRTVVVEQPLRLTFEITPDRLARLDGESVLTKNGLDLKTLKQALMSLAPSKVFTNRTAFLESLDAALRAAHISLKPPQYKALWQAFSERSKTADICLSTRGTPEPDPALRDTENIPLLEDVTAYFAREVEPYAPDAWIDHDKTKIGYEIPFSRMFYRHTPPRALTTIDADLKHVTSDIMAMLAEVSVA